MTHKATIRTGYRSRLAILGIIGLALSAWFFYDGAITYPHKRQIQLQYQKVRAEHPNTFGQIWTPIAQEHGWPDKPGAPLTHWDIYTQYCYAVPCLIFAILCGIGYVRIGRRWIACDEQGVRTSRGRFAPWDAIKSVDKARWDKKGIAVVHYEHEGKPGRIMLDDWKYDAQLTGAILKQVEQTLGQAPDAPPPQVETPTESVVTKSSGEVDPKSTA